MIKFILTHGIGPGTSGIKWIPTLGFSTGIVIIADDGHIPSIPSLASIPLFRLSEDVA